MMSGSSVAPSSPKTHPAAFGSLLSALLMGKLRHNPLT